MTQNFNETLSALFREIEIDLGPTELCILVMESLYEAVSDIKKEDLHGFFKQMHELSLEMTETKPRYSIIIDSFYEVLKMAFDEDIAHPDGTYPLCKTKFLNKLRQIITRRKQEKREIVRQSERIKFHGKTILLYDHGHTIQAVLTAAKSRGDRFSVIVAEQDPDKTGDTIEFLHKKRIPFRVVPSYMVTHLEQEIDMFILGALTLKSTMDFVMDTGANGLVSQFHLKGVPIYVFLSTSKFSLWKSEKHAGVYSQVHRRKHHLKSIDFERIKFSHDRVELRLVNKTVTEQGIHSPKQLKKSYEKKLEERLKLKERVKLLG